MTSRLVFLLVILWSPHSISRFLGDLFRCIYLSGRSHNKHYKRNRLAKTGTPVHRSRREPCEVPLWYPPAPQYHAALHTRYPSCGRVDGLNRVDQLGQEKV
jgi:hypothetical protein